MPIVAGDEVLWLLASFQASMTGGEILVTIRRLGDQIALLSFQDNEDPSVLEVGYGIRDWDDEMVRLVDARLEYFDALCPSCEEEVCTWRITFTPQMPPFTEAGVEAVAAALYRPCEVHDYGPGRSELGSGDLKFE